MFALFIVARSLAVKARESDADDVKGLYTVICLDASASMAGERWTSAQSFLQKYLHRKLFIFLNMFSRWCFCRMFSSASLCFKEYKALNSLNILSRSHVGKFHIVHRRLLKIHLLNFYQPNYVAEHLYKYAPSQFVSVALSIFKFLSPIKNSGVESFKTLAPQYTNRLIYHWNIIRRMLFPVYY